MRATLRASFVVACAIISAPAICGVPLDVTVIDRQERESAYTYVVPSRTTMVSSTSATCSGATLNTSCSATGSATGTTAPGFVGSYAVSGATLTLLLPDGRLVVVNCVAKVNWTEVSNPNFYRSCRVPLVNAIRAEFSGDHAKLKWPASIDGSKFASETYKILAILDKPQASAP